MQRFEYKVLIKNTAEELETALNEWGREGWRLVTTYVVEVAFAGHNVVATMERPLPTDEGEEEPGW